MSHREPFGQLASPKDVEEMEKNRERIQVILFKLYFEQKEKVWGG